MNLYKEKEWQPLPLALCQQAAKAAQTFGGGRLAALKATVQIGPGRFIFITVEEILFLRLEKIHVEIQLSTS